MGVAFPARSTYNQSPGCTQRKAVRAQAAPDSCRLEEAAAIFIFAVGILKLENTGSFLTLCSYLLCIFR